MMHIWKRIVVGSAVTIVVVLMAALVYYATGKEGSLFTSSAFLGTVISAVATAFMVDYGTKKFWDKN